MHDAARFRARSTSHSVAARNGCTNIPLAAVGAQEDETILEDGLFGHVRVRFVHLDPPGLIKSWKISGFGQRLSSGTFHHGSLDDNAAVTYFQSATSNLRASATIVVFLRRPPLRLTRSSNHRASAECG